ncbi:MAG: anaerobic ribonucleoside-triphosphate reductase activating protein [Ruminococcaceae bacterium]|nr:anaerobic ribonucleoside-triphosphate reductase activating protein [Oscillospiraceae bacterium]
MKLGGLQKLTLLDFPGKTACTVFTEGCNFRCPFCHNASLVKQRAAELPTEEFFAFLKKRQGLLDGVCVTGGEPLLQPDIEDFLSEIKSLGYAVKLDTNGSFPDKLIEIVENGFCDYVAMDIKNSKSKYLATAGVTRDILSDIEKSVDFLLSDAIDYEFRTTVVSPYHDFSDFYEIGAWIKGAKKYFLQSFIDSGDLLSDGMKAWKKEDMEAASLILQGFVPNVNIRGI